MFGFIFKKIFGSKNDRYLRRLRPIVARINALEPQMQELADEDFAQRMAEYRQQVQAGVQPRKGKLLRRKGGAQRRHQRIPPGFVGGALPR